MFQEVLYILMFGEGGKLALPRTDTAPPEHARTLTFSKGSEMFRVVVVCNAPLKPYENFYRRPETELGLLWTYTEEEHCTKGQGQKDCFRTGEMLD